LGVNSEKTCGLLFMQPLLRVLELGFLTSLGFELLRNWLGVSTWLLTWGLKGNAHGFMKRLGEMSGDFDFRLSFEGDFTSLLASLAWKKLYFEVGGSGAGL